MDLKAIQDELLNAMDKQKTIEQNNLDTMRRLNQQQVNVAASTRGTLFSSSPIFQGASYVASKLPQYVALNQRAAQNKMQITNSVKQVLDTINSYNQAAQELDNS